MPKTQAKRGMSPRELDALRKRYVAEQKQADSASKWQLANDIVSGINDIVGRGVIAPILGMPGDINQAIYDAGAWVNNKIKDVEVATGMVKQPRYVQPSQGNAYLGSEDIGNRMQQAGLVSSERRPMTELAASLVSPGAAAKTAINAPKTAMNMLRMADNLEAPSRGVRNAQGMYIPRGQMGAIELGVAEAPQAKALREAQINAAKPVSEGGLGLRPDNTPEERAMAMGFDTPAYHGTMNPVLNVDVGQARKFRNSETPIETALVSSSSPDVASTYAVSHGNKLNEWDTGIVQPLLINRGKNLRMNAGGREWSDLPYVEYSDSLEFPGGSTNNFASFANKLGYDSATIENVDDVGPGYELFRPWDSRSSVVFSFDPRNIRSRFAAFDPMRRNSSDLLAGIALPVVAAPVVSESDKKKRKDKKK